MVTDAIDASSECIKNHDPKKPDDVRDYSENLICRSPEMVEQESKLKKYLFDNMYRHYRLVRMAEKAERIITTLFDAYIDNPDQLPPQFGGRLKQEEVYTVVADYIAGMTDRFAGQEYKKLTDPFELV